MNPAKASSEHHTHDTGGNRVKGPVCGMDIDPDSAAGKTKYGGRTYHFCSSHWLARISHQIFTAAADPDMSITLRSVGLLDILSSMPAGPYLARLVSMPVCAASLRNLVRSAGWRSSEENPPSM